MGSEFAEEIDIDIDNNPEEAQAEDRGDDVAPGMGPDLDDDDETPPEDDEGEEQDEERAESDEQGEGEPQGQPDNGGYIPKPRFNEVNQALKAERAARIALEEEIARLRAGGQAAAPQSEQGAEAEQAAEFDFIEADRRYRSAIYDGDDAAADAIRAEIREAERKEAARLAEERAAELVRAAKAEEAEAATRAAVNAVTADAYERFPFLDNTSDAADADAIAMVIAVRNRHIETGLSPAEALSKAVDKVGPMFGTESAPRKAAARTAQQVLDKAEKRAARIPARPDGVGERVRSLDVAAMSEREFSALSDEDKRRARGDFVG